MTGSHEVRGSIPLGSTNNFDSLGPPIEWPFAVLCAYGVPTSVSGWEHLRRDVLWPVRWRLDSLSV